MNIGTFLLLATVTPLYTTLVFTVQKNPKISKPAANPWEIGKNLHFEKRSKFPHFHKYSRNDKNP